MAALGLFISIFANLANLPSNISVVDNHKNNG
jgi:hypothetical protein